MKYSEIQDKLRAYKAQKLTTVKLNSSFEVLEAELERLTVAKIQESKPETVEIKESETVVSWYVNGKECWQPPASHDEVVKSSQLQETDETDEPEYDENELVDYDEDDDTEDKLDDFLATVRNGQLNKEQLEAIALAMIVAHEKHQNLSISLAQIRKFQLFTPNQLLAWGFDEVIPGEGLFQQFQKAIASIATPKPEVNVNVKFSETGDNGALLDAWANSYGGKNWGSGCESEYPEEDWEFPKLEVAEKFVEYCKKLSFVIDAKIDKLATGGSYAIA